MVLTIKRVPTVLSNYQEGKNCGDDAADSPTAVVGCGQNCLGRCCLREVSKLPVYGFWSDTSPPISSCLDELPPGLFLNTLLLGQWEDRMNRGLFRYDVSQCYTKVIPGTWGFLAQFNEGRHLKKRPTEFQVDRVLQPFDHSKFNFTKVGQEEILFRFEPAGSDKFFSPFAPVDEESSPNVIAINVSPIELGHVLLIPRVLDCLPQRIDPESLLLALHLADVAASPYFRVGYNSLGAFATVNHLHFQAYYISLPFPVEKAQVAKIPLDETSSKSGIEISSLLHYPVKGLVFEGGSTLKELADVTATACICLQDKNIPYNVLISESGRRIFLFPQCYAEKQALGEVSQELLDTQVNPACWEISGHMVLKRMQDYAEASESSAWRLLAEVSLSEEKFREVKAYIFEAAGLVESKCDEEEEDPYEPTQKSHCSAAAAVGGAPAHIPEECPALQEDVILPAPLDLFL